MNTKLVYVVVIDLGHGQEARQEFTTRQEADRYVTQYPGRTFLLEISRPDIAS